MKFGARLCFYTCVAFRGVGFPACITGHIKRGPGGLPRGGLPPGGLHPGGLGRPTPWDNTEYGQQAGGTHPTGMNSRNTLVWR